MSDLARLSFSLEKPLLIQLEKLVKSSKYANRSEFIRDLIRGRLVQQEWERNAQAIGTIILIYTHHKRGLTARLTHLQHHYHDVILATTHVHLDADLCAEMVVVRGRARRLKELSDLLGQQKGVLHANLAVSSTGTHLH